MDLEIKEYLQESLFVLKKIYEGAEGANIRQLFRDSIEEVSSKRPRIRAVLMQLSNKANEIWQDSLFKEVAQDVLHEEMLKEYLFLINRTWDDLKEANTEEIEEVKRLSLAAWKVVQRLREKYGDHIKPQIEEIVQAAFQNSKDPQIALAWNKKLQDPNFGTPH